MIGYLLDTDVLSAFAPGKTDKPPPAAAVAEWLRRNHQLLFVSAVTVLEVEAGVLKLGRTQPGKRHDLLAAWFSSILFHYQDRVLPLDLSGARTAADLADRARAKGANPEFPDVIIAATAISRQLTLLTRNLRHFRLFGIEAVDPFRNLPG